jgi:hypothetical protein
MRNGRGEQITPVAVDAVLRNKGGHCCEARRMVLRGAAWFLLLDGQQWSQRL